MDLALISEQLGAAAVVEQLASYDHDQALIAVADYLEGLDLEALRGHRIRTKVLEAAVEGLGPDDIVDGTLELRRTKIAQAKNRLRAIALATEREVGQRLAELEPDRGGHPSDGNDRRAAKTIFGLNKHQTSLLIRLAALDEDAFSRAVAQAQASKGDVSIATIVRFGSADADWTMDESSTPPHVVNLCREVGGKAFDMDGASHLAAQVAHVRAIRWCGKGTPKMGRRERAWQR
ncbi:MAG: hypothetical protein KC457_32525, partial [Myxococcales bacterium]|nr:hypothetical protein [Myxococcales bacterium]